MFDWGGTGDLFEKIDYTLVYDESDEITLPTDRRTVAWKRGAGSAARWEPYREGGVSIDVKALEGHFYLVTFISPRFL